MFISDPIAIACFQYSLQFISLHGVLWCKLKANLCKFTMVRNGY